MQADTYVYNSTLRARLLSLGSIRSGQLRGCSLGSLSATLLKHVFNEEFASLYVNNAQMLLQS